MLIEKPFSNDITEDVFLKNKPQSSSELQSENLPAVAAPNTTGPSGAPRVHFDAPRNNSTKDHTEPPEASRTPPTNTVLQRKRSASTAGFQDSPRERPASATSFQRSRRPTCSVHHSNGHSDAGCKLQHPELRWRSWVPLSAIDHAYLREHPEKMPNRPREVEQWRRDLYREGRSIRRGGEMIHVLWVGFLRGTYSHSPSNCRQE